VRLFAFAITLSLITLAHSWWLYQSNIVPLLNERDDDAGAGTSQEQRPVVADHTQTIARLEEQIDAMRRENATQQEQLTRLQSRLSAPPIPATSDLAGLPAVGGPGTDVLPIVTGGSAADELRLLKERNRLTAFADECISTGMRRPFDLLMNAFSDPARANLYHAAKAEYYRVASHYHMMNRIDPAYKLPVLELFPDSKVKDEADLSVEQIIELMNDYEQEWQVRLRAAYLLGGHRTPEAGEALIHTMKNDPHLDVAKEAQLSFEQTFGRHFHLFDTAGLEAWWKEQNRTETAAESAR
jgi:hypothetical protein